jgi:hypothetical protein
LRFVYLDESGISNPQHEPYVVVAGPIVHADKQWIALERYLNDMADDVVPPEKRDGFVFHATELFSGGANFPRDAWPREDRWKILDELVSIGSEDKFDLPFVYGSVERARYKRRYPHVPDPQATVSCQVISWLMCLYAIEYYMQRKAPDEVATIVMENNDQARKLIKHMYAFVRNPANKHLLETTTLGPLAPEHIVDDVHFTEKRRTSPLQIADAAAFCIKRHLMGAADSDRFWFPLKSRLVLLPKSELEST